jgi:DNA polymerase-1
MIQYAAMDAYYTLKVKQAQDAEIDKRHYDNRTYLEIDEPNIWAVLDMKPIKVNTKRWLEMAVEFEQRGRELEGELGINVNSHTQVKAYILKTLRKTIDNTEAQTLEGLQSDVADKILLARQYRKATSTYGEKWVQNNVEADGLVYADFQVSGAETGRMVCSSPNLQQLPARKIPEYRKLFVSSKGKLIIADIQAQEPRCLAYLSGDKVLRQVFDDKQDIHLSVAKAVFQDDTITKSDPRRDIGKVINLATSYGMTAKGLAERLRISEDEAQKFLDNYFAKFFGVRMYIDRQRDLARRFEYVESITGRRVWINPYNFQWENNAANSPIQSSAADFTKMWMNTFWKLCQEEEMEFPVCLVVHDELVLDVQVEHVDLYKDMLDWSAKHTADTLFSGMEFPIEIHVGTSWGSKKEED